MCRGGTTDVEDNVFSTKKQFQGAMDHYKKATELAPRSYQALNGLGVTYLMVYVENRQDRQMARDGLECLHQSLEINPDQPKIKGWIDKYSPEVHAAGQPAAAGQ